MSTLPGQRLPEPQDFSASQAQAQAFAKVQLLERKRVEYEKIREQKRRFEVEMQKLDQQQRREEQELAQMTEDLGRFASRDSMAGHLSEPTTPPEYRETAGGFPTMFSRPNRYSTSSLTSPPGLYNRQSRPNSQIASPQSGIMQSRLAFDDQLPSRSVPGSRRNSDEDEKEEAVRQDPTSYRATSAYVHPFTKPPLLNSLPITLHALSVGCLSHLHIPQSIFYNLSSVNVGITSYSAVKQAYPSGSLWSVSSAFWLAVLEVSRAVQIALPTTSSQLRNPSLNCVAESIRSPHLGAHICIQR